MILRKKAICSLIIWGITYTCLFSFLIYKDAFPAWHDIDSWKELIGSVNPFLPLLMLPISVFIMLTSYFAKCYTLTRYAWILPPLTALILSVICLIF